jgi:transposase InsO family protein
MTWKETCVMDQRMRFVVARAEGAENMSELCRHFGISRKTGYKWWRRYCADGVVGLSNRSRAPAHHPRAVDEALIEPIVALRHRYPTWGPRKIKAWLEDHEPAVTWPAASTIGSVLDAHGLTRHRKRRQKTPPYGRPFATAQQPNDVWCADFKGWFLTGDGIQVDPFTLSDAHSRFLLCLEAVGRTDTAHVWPILETAFRDYGLPRALRTDNGPPFAGRGVAGLSRLAVTLIKAGVVPERIEPGQPQQNGRHERMHLTLKQDTASPPAQSLAEQIVRFRSFREIYNHQRPHEALDQVPPARIYRPSPRLFDGRLRSPDYDDTVEVRKVRRNGEIKWRGSTVYLSSALIGEPVGLYRIGEETWLAKYGPLVLGTVKGKIGLIRPNEKQVAQ